MLHVTGKRDITGCEWTERNTGTSIAEGGKQYESSPRIMSKIYIRIFVQAVGQCEELWMLGHPLEQTYQPQKRMLLSVPCEDGKWCVVGYEVNLGI